MRVLLVEDDDDLAEVVARGLRREHLAVDRAGSIDDAVDCLLETSYDLVCLDIGLPDGDGVELCRRLHRGELRRPGRILMLTARDSVADRVDGLDAGADDYLVKPFSVAELAARIRALVRRRDQDPGTVAIGDLEVDLTGHCVRRAGRAVGLTGREYAVLRYLTVRCGEIVSSEDLLEHCWDRNADSFSGSVRVILSRLRRKLGEPCPIETVRGLGYRLQAGA